jgi:riboflavin-specific deaminase-like protein
MECMHALPLETGPRMNTESLTAAYAADRAVPALRLNFVSSIDGAATVDGKSAPLGTDADQRVFTLLRKLCDGLLVGAGTVRVEGYNALRSSEEQMAWRVEHGLDRHPRMVIVSSRLDLDPGAPLFTDAPVRPVIVTHAASDTDRRRKLSDVADVVVQGRDRVDLRAALQDLRSEYDLSQLLCEGGPHLFADLWAADLVDELCLTISPRLAGPGADRIIVGERSLMSPPTTPLRLHHAIAADSALLLRYVRP